MAWHHDLSHRGIEFGVEFGVEFGAVELWSCRALVDRVIPWSSTNGCIKIVTSAQATFSCTHHMGTSNQKTFIRECASGDLSHIEGVAAAVTVRGSKRFVFYP